jgi:hypothetical protein
MKRIIFIIASIALVAALFTAAARKGSVLEPWEQSTSSESIKFSHKFHVSEASIACEDCHKAAKTSNLSSDNLRANHDNCTTCHEEQINNNCAYCHKNPDNIEAVQLQERFIVFSHAKHVEMRGVECVTCHRGLDQVDYAGPKNMPDMATCNTCHNNIQAANTCESCHTRLVNLIPRDHLVANFKKDHRQLTRVGALEASCATCHTQSFCADCHSSAGLLNISTKDLMTDPMPRGSASASPQQLRLQMAHDLNYRFTHGIDAKAKSAECFTCHSAQEFCERCHAGGSNITEGSFKPSWHLGPDFTRIGVGSGGGRHAGYARRDIENCMTCHDVRGGDPTCMQCHTDADGIRGTDPKTHPAGFRGDDEGSWHKDPGATCYSCHTDMNAHPGGKRGVGFCGYCHH